MKFDNETSIIQQKIANGYAGVSRRLAIVNALNLETNETVIDICLLYTSPSPRDE